MNTSIDREGNANDLIYTEEAAAVLGITLETFKVGRAVGYAPLSVTKQGSRLVFRRGDLWDWLDNRDAGRAKIACGIAGCRHVGYAKTGYCPEHAKRIAARGTADGMGPLPTRSRKLTDAARFATFTEEVPSTGCTDWVGGDSGNSGYGKATFKGRKEQAHRVSFHLKNGRWPEEELDHECGRRSCVRLGPGHVVEVTKADNMKKMFDRHAALKATTLRQHVAVADLLAAAETAGGTVSLVDLWQTVTAALPEAA